MDGTFAAVTYVCQKRTMKYLDNLISEPGTQKISCLRNGRFQKMQQFLVALLGKMLLLALAQLSLTAS